MIKRHKTRKIILGNVEIGGDNPIRVQSMTNTHTYQWEETIAQINKLSKVGCEIVRVTVPDNRSLKVLDKITSSSKIPVIADIHFNYKLAIESLNKGVKGLRINPGNIGGKDRFLQVIKELKKYPDVALRIGVNAGSLEKKYLLEYEKGKLPLYKAMVYSALEYLSWAEEKGFYNIKISLKASDVFETIKAYELFSKKSDYPLHIGITEAGPLVRGSVKSAIGIGILLYKGLGDTIRVSLSDDPVWEVKVAYEILRSLHLRKYGVEIISCPTCGRTEIDLIKLTREVEKIVEDIKKPLKVAIMGCIVNGPGEARDADIGICGGKKEGIIFKKGKPVKKVPIDKLLQEFSKEIYNIIKENDKK